MESFFLFKKKIPLRSAVDRGEYGYALYNLNPYGYAVLTKDGYLMERKFQIGAKFPVELDSDEEYYYIGISSIAVADGEKLKDLSTMEYVSNNYLDYLSGIEDRVRAELSDGKGLYKYDSNARASAANTRVVIQESYFEELVNFGNNTNYTCMALAMSTLLGYYDIYVNDAYISNDSAYMAQTSGYSLGTNEAFHQYMCNFAYGSSSPTSLSFTTMCSNLASYFDSISLGSFFVQPYTKGKMKTILNSGRPIIGAYSLPSQSDDDPGHVVVVYGYEVTGTVTEYLVHDGYLGANLSGTLWNSIVVIPSAWFFSCAHIFDCRDFESERDDSTKHNYTISYTGNNWPQGSMHYYERIKTCRFCSKVVREQYSIACNGNCIEMMSIPGGDDFSE